MKLVKRTPTELILKSYPWFKLAMASILSTIGLMVFLFASEWGAIACRREALQPTQGHCTLTRSTFFNHQYRRWPLPQVFGVTWQGEGRQKNGQPFNYRMYLSTRQGSIALPLTYEESGEAAAIADTFQEFLADPQRSDFQLQQDHRAQRFREFLLCAFVGGCFAIRMCVATLHLNRQTGLMTLKRFSILGQRTIERPLDQIIDVCVEEKRHGSHLMGRIVLMDREGEAIVVHPYDLGVNRWSTTISMEQIQGFLARSHNQ